MAKLLQYLRVAASFPENAVDQTTGMLHCQRLVSYLIQCWISVLHQTISTTREVRDQQGVIDV